MAESNVCAATRTSSTIEMPGMPETIATGEEDSEGSISDSSDRSDTGMDTSSYGGSYEPSSPGSVQH